MTWLISPRLAMQWNEFTQPLVNVCFVFELVPDHLQSVPDTLVEIKGLSLGIAGAGESLQSTHDLFYPDSSVDTVREQRTDILEHERQITKELDGYDVLQVRIFRADGRLVAQAQKRAANDSHQHRLSA